MTMQQKDFLDRYYRERGDDKKPMHYGRTNKKQQNINKSCERHVHRTGLYL